MVDRPSGRLPSPAIAGGSSGSDYVAIFNRSFVRLTSTPREGKTFFDVFYSEFMARSEEIAAHFAGTDMRAQREMLRKSLLVLLEFYVAKRESQTMLEIALRHGRRDLNIRPQLYEEWLSALVAALQICDPRFDRHVELAWRVVLAPGIAFMQFHH